MAWLLCFAMAMQLFPLRALAAPVGTLSPTATPHVLFPGYNLIALPGEIPGVADAFDLLTHLGGPGVIDRVLRFDATSGRYQEARFDENGLKTGENFPLVPGEGLVVYSHIETPLSFTGTARCIPYVLTKGFHLIGVPCPSPGMRAYELLEELGGEMAVVSVQRFNRFSGGFETALFHEGLPRGVDFPLVAGEGYAVTLLEDIPPLPTITGFNPESAPVGTLVTIQGNHFSPVPGAFPQVAIARQGGGTVAVTVGRFDDKRIDFTIPTGATSGPITVTILGNTVISATDLEIVASHDFTMTAGPNSAEMIRGETVSYAIKLKSDNAFNQLAPLQIAGLPLGVTATFKPRQITAGQTSILTLSAPETQPLGRATLTVSAEAAVDGIPVRAAVDVGLEIVPVTTSFRGRTVISDPLQTPLGGVTVTLLGRDGNGNTTGCTGTTIADAAGNFQFTNLPAACVGPQMIRYDGLTATATGNYAGVDLVYNIADGQVTEAPVLIHLPRIDNSETVMIQQNAPEDQTFTFDSIPNLKVTVYAGTTFTLPDGVTQPDPFPLTAVQVPVDRLPDEMPPDPTGVVPFIVAFQPANATASQPVAVSFPNQLNTPPGTNMPLMTLDPTKGEMVQYGTGTVSDDGTQVIPDFDPAFPGTNRRFGLVHFDWHGFRQFVINLFNAGKECLGFGDPVDLVSGLQMVRETDIALSGTRGSIAIQRVYRTLSANAGPFGLGSNHNYGYRLDTRTPNTTPVVNLVMPDGNLLALSRQDALPLSLVSVIAVRVGGRRRTLRINRTNPKLQGAVLETFSDGKADLHWKNGTIFHFAPSTFALGSVLTGISDPNGNKTTLIRNPSRPAQITEIIDPVGRKLNLSYDTTDRITAIADPLGRTVRYTYNARGTLETVTDPEGGITRYDYDLQNRLNKITDTRGVVVAQNTFDANGRVIEQIQADGGILKFAYQLMNPDVPASPVLVTTTTDALGNKKIYRFNPQGYLIGVTDALGQTRVLERQAGTNRLLAVRGVASCNICGVSGAGDQAFTYDASGNRLTATDALGNTTRFTYEPERNRVTSVIDPLGHETRFAYDGGGNLLSVTDANGNATSFDYDLFGLLQGTTDPLGQQTVIDYDHFANPVSVSDSLSQVTASEFDAVSRPVAQVNALRQRTGRTFDKLNRATSATDAQGRTTRFAYDQVGNLLSVTDARGHVTTFTYDSMNRLLTRTDPLGNSDSRSYDLNGNLIRFVDRRGQPSAFTYDALNRLIAEAYQDGSVVARVYDARGLLVRVDDSEGGIFTFAYDPAGRLIRATGPFGTVAYKHDPRGSVITRQVVGQDAVHYAYDPVGNLLSASILGAGIDFTYDARNQMTRQSRSNGVTTDFGYDPLGRLASLSHANALGELNHQSYEYDPAGRRVATTTAFAQPLATQAATEGVDPLSNRMLVHDGVSYTYDQNGNRLSETGPGGTTTYLWDARNRLKSVTPLVGETLTFRYDPAGNMIEQTTGAASKQFVLDDLTNVVFQSGGDGSPFSVLTGRSIDSHFGVLRTGGQTDYVLSDGLNSTAAVSDETGAVNGTASYEPFGATTQTGEMVPFQFTGRVPVSSGLYYYRARFYDPNAGRFISEDPIGFAGGDVNLYRYVGNDPVRFMDPEGLLIEKILNFSGGVASKTAAKSELAHTRNERIIVAGAVGAYLAGVPAFLGGCFAGLLVGGPVGCVALGSTLAIPAAEAGFVAGAGAELIVGDYLLPLGNYVFDKYFSDSCQFK